MPFGPFRRKNTAGVPERYTGPAFPAGSLGAVAVGSELTLELPGGAGVEVVFRVRGKPANSRRHSSHGHHVWQLPEINFSLMPADASTPRLRPLNPRVGRVNTDIDSFGYSEKGFGWFEVPPPGGRYVMRVSGPVQDAEAHVVLMPI